MESNSQESSLKLRSIIENLLKEKDELSQRLIRANHDKLLQNPSQGEEEEKPVETEEALTNVYLWNCGILHSSVPIDKLINQSPPLEKRGIASYILKLNQEAADQGAQKLYMLSLRTSKKEGRDLKLEIQRLNGQLLQAHKI